MTTCLDQTPAKVLARKGDRAPEGDETLAGLHPSAFTALKVVSKRPRVSSETFSEAYPYDPGLRIESQRGLDRLRCVADRALAANLFALFEAAELNSAAATAGASELETRRMTELEALKAHAARALEGELGAQPKELADSLLLDERGERVTDERSLREFAFVLRQLRRLAG